MEGGNFLPADISIFRFFIGFSYIKLVSGGLITCFTNRCWSVFGLLMALLVNILVINEHLKSTPNHGDAFTEQQMYSLRILVGLLGPIIEVTLSLVMILDMEHASATEGSCCI